MPESTLYSQPNPNGGLINSPEINASGTPTQHSIKDIGQARDVVRTLIAANRESQIVNSRILAKYNAERPHDSRKLEMEGLGWKQNFTTKPLPSMIEKVAPRFTEVIAKLKYLTNASLDPKWEKATEKTEKFRQEVTETIRARKGWRVLIEDIAFDNALFGHTLVSWLDEYTWLPIHFKQDENFLSDGCKQSSDKAQFVALKELWLPHEFFEQIKDRETATLAGFNIPNSIKCINGASPSQLRDLLNVSGSSETWYQNALRELNVGASYMAGASVIVVYSLLVREVTGKVSHYRMAGTELLEIFSKDNRFDSMEDCLAFFSFQKGNGTMRGSKGIGRDIYELAGMIDRTRNEVVDRAILSGKTMVQGDMKRIHTFKMSIIGAMVIIPSGWEVITHKVDGDIEPFLKLDAYFGMLVDQLIGSTSPRQFGGERVTKAEVDLFAAREEEGKDARITRFVEQFTDLMGTIQTRICDPDTTEEDAKAMQKRLLSFMSKEELDELANKPVAGTVTDLTPLERQMIAAFSSEKKGNPLYNQRQLEVEDATARVGSDFANRVLLPANDPTEQAEQQRFQQLETMMLLQGIPVPVSARDNHMIHLATVMPMAEAQAQALMQGQANTQNFEVTIAHITEHLSRAQEQGVPSEKLKPIEEFVKKAGPALQKLKQLDEQAQKLSQTAQEHDSESQDIASGGGPAPGE